MANKSYFYIAVQTNDGIKLVTEINNANKTCQWQDNEKPYEFTKSYAESVILGLNLNFIPAFLLKSLYKLENQF